MPKPRIDLTQILEDAIMGKLVSTMIEEGYRVELCDQDGGLIIDYTTNLQAVLKPVDDFADMFRD